MKGRKFSAPLLFPNTSCPRMVMDTSGVSTINSITTWFRMVEGTVHGVTFGEEMTQFLYRSRWPCVLCRWLSESRSYWKAIAAVLKSTVGPLRTAFSKFTFWVSVLAVFSIRTGWPEFAGGGIGSGERKWRHHWHNWHRRETVVEVGSEVGCAGRLNGDHTLLRLVLRL